MICVYCSSLIDQTEDGWGWTQEGMERENWHYECFEEEEL